MRAPLALIVSATMLAACAEDLDIYSEIEDLRVLAIRADPPEVLLDLPQPFDLRFDALVVDPAGQPVTFEWSFCPVESGNACHNFETIRERAEPGFQDDLDALRAIEASGKALPQPDADGLDAATRATRGLWPIAVPPFDIQIDTSFFLYHFDDSLLGGGLGVWPSAVLNVWRGDWWVEAQKRIVVGIEDLRSWADLIAADYGYRVCAEGETPADDPGCLYIRDRVPNTNPVFERIDIARSKLATAPFVPFTDDILEMDAGDTIRIRPILTEASSESFQTLRIDIQTGTIIAEDRVEDISVSWFVSHGSVGDELTWPKFTKSLDTEYDAPGDAPDTPGDIATVWMVARDQRGGIAWENLEIKILTY